MRVSFLSLVVVLLVVISRGTPANAQAGTLNTFSTDLSFGSSGAQVIALQQILNRDPDTRIASVGPGSPGNETDYFGQLTKAAVVRFQEKYASEVLAPARLAQGSGYVGLYTRTKLNSLSAVTVSGGGVSPPVTSPTTAPPLTSSASTTASQNPNLQNLDTFLADIDTVATKQGVSAAAIATIKSVVMKEAATTTDLRAAFLKAIHADSTSAMDNSFVGRALATIGQMFNTVFGPQQARAATGIPFGGALVFPFFCNQSNTWLIDLEPLPPSYATLLTYIPESQKYLSYNTPITNELLGTYAPGAGVCVVGGCPFCVFIPSEGMITPILGSSPG
ncbi:MAG: peptidoglycan-binding domain-containing protein [Minisyncoccota bacterium]